MRFQIYRATETQLVEGCKKHDRHAQELLYKKFSGKMYAVCCRYIRDKMEAEDVLVTAFTKIFERMDQYKGDGSLEGWIRKVMINEALTYLRKNKNMYLEIDIESVHHEQGFDPMESKLEAEDLLSMIADLPVGYRMVFNMFAIDGYSHKEIADHLGIHENTSKSQLSRARAVLQKHLFALERETNKSQQRTTINK